MTEVCRQTITRKERNEGKRKDLWGGGGGGLKGRGRDLFERYDKSGSCRAGGVCPHHRAATQPP